MKGEEEPLRCVSVGEIHAYPSRPPGFEEPLFPTAGSRRAVAEHLLRAPWLERASELVCRRGGESARAPGEPVEVRESSCGRVEVLRSFRVRGRCSWRRRRVARVLDSWREVGLWWDEGRRTDRLVFRVLLSGGAVVELARERSGGWSLAGVAD